MSETELQKLRRFVLALAAQAKAADSPGDPAERLDSILTAAQNLRTALGTF